MFQKIFQLTALLLITSTMAYGAEISCPSSLTSKPEITGVFQGWEALTLPTESTLNQVAVYLHHPKEKGSLVPDRTRKSKGHDREIWTFVSTTEDYWVACLYNNTSAMLVQQLPAGVKQCVADYLLLPTGSRLKLNSFKCK